MYENSAIPTAIAAIATNDKALKGSILKVNPSRTATTIATGAPPHIAPTRSQGESSRRAAGDESVVAKEFGGSNYGVEATGVTRASTER